VLAGAGSLWCKSSLTSYLVFSQILAKSSCEMIASLATSQKLKTKTAEIQVLF
jgi:hypothetical protein